MSRLGIRTGPRLGKSHGGLRKAKGLGQGPMMRFIKAGVKKSKLNMRVLNRKTGHP